MEYRDSEKGVKKIKMVRKQYCMIKNSTLNIHKKKSITILRKVFSITSSDATNISYKITHIKTTNHEPVQSLQ